jgi:hypothetical protein
MIRFGMVPVTLLEDPEVNDGMLRTYAGLAAFARSARTANPTVRQVAELTGKDERTVKRHLAALVELGHLERRAWGGGRGRGSTYHLNGLSTGTERVTSVARKGDIRVHRTSYTENYREHRHAYGPLTDHRGTFLPGTGWVQ